MLVLAAGAPVVALGEDAVESPPTEATPPAAEPAAPAPSTETPANPTPPAGDAAAQDGAPPATGAAPTTSSPEAATPAPAAPAETFAGPTFKDPAAKAAAAGEPDPLDDPNRGVWMPSLFGDPLPLSRRAPTNRRFTLELDIRYALVGTGPTRFVNDLRFSILDWWEIRTQMGPVLLPESLVTRVSVGSWRKTGRFGVEAGFHKADIGLRLFPEEGESRGFNAGIIPSFNLVGAVTYDVPIWTMFSFHVSARAQQRLQHSVARIIDRRFTNPLSQFSYQVAAAGTWDMTRTLGVTFGMAWGQAIDNSVYGGIMQRATEGTLPWNDPALPRLNIEKGRKRGDPFAALDTQGVCAEGRTKTIFIDYVESARPGYSSMVDRDNNCSLTLNTALTYGRTEAFDVDLFSAFRVWPTLGGMFGAGVRWRVAP